jgi:hypothetical protein
VNRRIVDHVSDINLVYTEHARRYLLAEACAGRDRDQDRLADEAGLCRAAEEDRRSKVLANLG